MKTAKMEIELSENYLVNIIKLRGDVLESRDGEKIRQKINQSIQGGVQIILIDIKDIKYIVVV